MGKLNDLAHSGMSHALQMRDEDGSIGPNYSEKNQTLLLHFANSAVMFATMTCPGTMQKYWHEIRQRADSISKRGKFLKSLSGIST